MPLRRYEHVSGSSREETRATAARLYSEGATVRAIATELGRSYGFVHRILIESEVPLRSRGVRSHVAGAGSEIPGQLELTASDTPA